MQAGERLLHILHTSDLHGQVEAMPYLATVAREKRAALPGALLLDAGGWAHGGAISDAFQGRPMIEIMNELAYTAAGVGEGDLHWGPEALSARAAEARFPILAANLLGADGRMLPRLQPYVVIDGIALIGICSEGCARPGLTLVSDPRSALRSAMRDAGADVVIVLSHLGLEGDRRLAQLPGIHAIVGVAPAQPERVGETVIAGAGPDARNIGVLTLHLSDKVPLNTRREEPPQ